jgi:hypothetical protein
MGLALDRPKRQLVSFQPGPFAGSLGDEKRLSPKWASMSLAVHNASAC